MVICINIKALVLYPDLPFTFIHVCLYEVTQATLVFYNFVGSLTHDVQDVVSYLSRSDGALLGVSLQDLQHGLQLVQSAVLTLLTDELSTHRLEKHAQSHYEL